METYGCNTFSIIIILLCILLIGLLPNIYEAIPKIRLLFDDNTNFMLLVIIAIGLIILDLPAGLMLSLFIIYATLFFQRIPKIVTPTKPVMPILQEKIIPLRPIPVLPGDVPNSQLRLPPDVKLLPDIISVPPNPDVAPPGVETFTSDSACGKMAGAVRDNGSMEPTVIPPLIVSPKYTTSRAGYDVSGCRFDLKENEQNLTVFGPPLSACSQYNLEQTNKVGTVFYPINP